MDYKKEYLKGKLHKQVYQHQQNYMDPHLLDKLENLCFVVEDSVLSVDVHAVIISLLHDFYKIVDSNICHNLELSQYYGADSALMTSKGHKYCDNCEVVLKYTDASVCITDGRITRVIENGSPKDKIECNISHGIIRFFIRRKHGSMLKYTKIHVVELKDPEHLSSFKHSLYQNGDSLTKIQNSADVAMNKGLTDTLSKISRQGNPDTKNYSNLIEATNRINYIVSEANKASNSAQLSKVSRHEVMSTVPSQRAVNAANTVATTVMKSNPKQTEKMSAIMIPGNEPLSLDPRRSKMRAIIDNKGVSVGDRDNRMSYNSLRNASIMIDATIAIVPIKKLYNNDVQIGGPSDQSPTSVINKLSSWKQEAQDILMNIGNEFSGAANKIGETTNKIVGFFSGNQGDRIVRNTAPTITPVSEHTSVMTSLGSSASEHIPVPQNDKNITISQSNNPISNYLNKHASNLRDQRDFPSDNQKHRYSRNTGNDQFIKHAENLNLTEFLDTRRNHGNRTYGNFY